MKFVSITEQVELSPMIFASLLTLDRLVGVRSVKQISDILTNLILVQTICKGMYKMTIEVFSG